MKHLAHYPIRRTYMNFRNLGALGLVAVGLLAGADARGLHAQQPSSLGIDTTNFDRSVRPQDDFYEYVNGGWLRSTELPADRSRYGSFHVLAEKSEQAMREVIDEAVAAVAAGTATPSQQKIGDYYRSFMDTARVERLGATPLQDELGRIAGLSGKEALPGEFAHLQRIGVQTPLAFYVMQDRKQADRYIAYASQSGLGLPDRDYYSKEGESFEKARAAYADYIATLFRLAGQPDPVGAASRIVALENRLAAAQWERARMRDPEAVYNLYPVADLGTLTPAFDWDAYLAALGVRQTPGVVVQQPSYFQELDRAIADTPLQTWREYLAFKLIDANAAALSSDFVDARFAFRGGVLNGLEENRPRWKRGVSAVEDALGEELGRLYVERYFTAEQKASMEELVDNLVAAFRQGIDELEWMSPATKAAAQEKLARFTVKIGYPDEWRDYSALTVRADDLVGNTMRASEFGFAEMVGRLGQPVNREEWLMTPQTVNAYYNPLLNEIVFPAAILQPPFFNFAADDAVNYGAIGAVIGHEISHGFDDQGRQSDGEGNLRDWWTEADATAFEERADRLVEQYEGFNPVDDLHINGRLTLGENIGDLSGLAVAYRAYQLSLDGREAPVIDGLSGDQRFFMGWAQIWRTLSRDEALRQQLLTDPHSPERYRVNGVLPNMPEFYEAFGVVEGDEMYLPPAERVKIW